MGICEKEKFLYLKYIHLRQIYLEEVDKPVNVSIMPLLDKSKHFHKNCASENCVTPRNWKFQKLSFKASLWLQLGGIAVHHDIVNLVAKGYCHCTNPQQPSLCREWHQGIDVG